MAYEQMNTDSAPTIPFDTRVDVVGLAPFARDNLAAVFTGDSRYVAIFVQLTAVDAAVGSINKTVGHVCRFLRHAGAAGRFSYRHNDGRPTERPPVGIIAGRLRQHRAQLCDLLLRGNTAEDGGEVHGITLAGPDAS